MTLLLRSPIYTSRGHSLDVFNIIILNEMQDNTYAGENIPLARFKSKIHGT